MQFISCHDGKIITSRQCPFSGTGARGNPFRTGFPAIDDLLPDRSFTRGSIHEILFDPRHPSGAFFALLIARSAAGAIVWCDPDQTLYPPAVASAGISLEKLFLLHPQSPRDQSWALAECMRCKGVAVTVAPVSRLNRIEARRLQLSAEQGGGVGLLLRPMDRHASVYAAVSRWLVTPAHGERTVQRWNVQLIHAHGGRVGKTVILEHHRETNLVRAAEQLADRQGEETAMPIRVSA